MLGYVLGVFGLVALLVAWVVVQQLVQRLDPAQPGVEGYASCSEGSCSTGSCSVGHAPTEQTVSVVGIEGVASAIELGCNGKTCSTCSLASEHGH